MIEKFRLITNDGDTAWIETDHNKYGSDENISFYYKPNQSRKEVFRVINNPHKGLSWTYKGKEIRLLDDTFRKVMGFPSLDMQYVVAFYVESEKYPDPNSLVVYNADGSIHLENIAPPKLLTFDKYVLAEFIQFYWDIDRDNNILTNAMRIVVDRWSVETREFDPKTGEFGKVIPGSTRL